MKLQQLKYICEVAKNDLNISTTAYALHTSQPGVSKQIRMLEEELGVQIFARNGKNLTRITPVGEAIIEQARQVLGRVGSIQRAAEEYTDEKKGSLSIATTHTQARYALPPVIKNFIGDYPGVSLHMHQGSPEQIAEMASRGEVDFAIATEGLNLFENLVMLPCYKWNRAIILPKNHNLAAEPKITLKMIAEHPIVTYVFGFTGRSKLDDAFKREGLKANVVFTATDADVIKTYVRLGLGIGILAGMAYDPVEDADLTCVDASHLFPPSTAMIGGREGSLLRGYMYDFIKLFAPHLDNGLVSQAFLDPRNAELSAQISKLDLPLR